MQKLIDEHEFSGERVQARIKYMEFMYWISKCKPMPGAQEERTTWPAAMPEDLSERDRVIWMTQREAFGY